MAVIIEMAYGKKLGLPVAPALGKCTIRQPESAPP